MSEQPQQIPDDREPDIFCVVCGLPWPCEYAGTPSAAARITELEALTSRLQGLVGSDGDKILELVGKVNQLQETIDIAMVLAERGDAHGRIVHALKYADVVLPDPKDGT